MAFAFMGVLTASTSETIIRIEAAGTIRSVNGLVP